MRADYWLLFILFDYFAAIIFGVVASVAAGWLLPGGWPMPALMVAGMLVGMATAFPLLALFSMLFGGFEIIMMSMLIGMMAGMAGVMADGAHLCQLSLYGAITGVAIESALVVGDLLWHGQQQAPE